MLPQFNTVFYDTIGSDRIGSDRIGSDRIGSDRIGSDRISRRFALASIKPSIAASSANVSAAGSTAPECSSR